ncbi:hypothetical protein HB779_06710 [Phyllobacterium sp. 628]|uniref:hypothetical protein n=1 Tax=Phyllobacterium sp. 628 TaxID=2718938 RepID=UPI0016625295|nr:hypothetical protein [Phyllobacterium sp. 628]QND51622.1 hypothetical protein HB779_06710 [Phyllobacterium sp. 628]
MSKFAVFTAMTLLTLGQSPVSHAEDFIILTEPAPDVHARQPGPFSPQNWPKQENSVPITPESVAAAVDQRIRALFDRAADPDTHLVTIASAERAGVGYFVDHFKEIDRDHAGSLDFTKVKAFFDAQSPIARPASTGIQIIK